MRKDHDPKQSLTELRARGIDVAVDQENGTMCVSFPRWVEADLLADLLRRDHADDPVEAARNIWILVAPVLRRLGWTDERIIREYSIPDAVVSGEAGRRAGVRAAIQRAYWELEEPGSLFRGERPLIEAFRFGVLPEEVCRCTHGEFMQEVLRRENLVPEPPPALPDSELRVHTEGGFAPDDRVIVTLDHRPTWRRAAVRSCRRRATTLYVDLQSATCSFSDWAKSSSVRTSSLQQTSADGCGGLEPSSALS
jgi:hypothetical protein